jgi:hypothetical protein
MAYALPVRQFFNWCEERGLPLEAVRPTTVAAYVEQLGVRYKQRFAFLALGFKRISCPINSLFDKGALR